MNFYTSDLHFFHKNICNLTDRNTVTNPENHTQWLIDLWNSQVSEYDTVYVLGDFSFGNLNKTKEVIQKLKGKIILILGNHDKESYIKLLYDSELIDFYFNYLEIKIEGVKTCMSHYPMVSWNKKHYGSYMLHAHTHGHYTPETGKILDVGLDNYYNIYGTYGFFSEKQIVDYMNSRKDQDTDHHNRGNLKETEVEIAKKESERMQALSQNSKQSIDYMNAQAALNISEGVKNGKVQTIIIPSNVTAIGSFK